MKYTFLLCLLLLFSCQNKDSNTSNSPESNQTPVEVPSETKTWTEEYMELVNNHRLSIGKWALIHSDQLARIVEIHSIDMAKKTVAFGHDGFSERCSDSRRAMGGGNWCGENVAMGQKSPKDVFNAWMNSSGHRANIEQSRATHTGFGYAKSSNGTYYWTQIFLEL